MGLPTENQVNAALRHVGTASASVASVFVVLGFLTPDQSQAIIADMQQIVAGLQQAFGGFSKLAIIVGPIFAGLMATFAAKSGSVTSIIATLLKTAHANTIASDEAKTAIVNAAAGLPEVEKVVAPALAPIPATSPTVTVQ